MGLGCLSLQCLGFLVFGVQGFTLRVLGFIVGVNGFQVLGFKVFVKDTPPYTVPIIDSKTLGSKQQNIGVVKKWFLFGQFNSWCSP